MAKKKALYKIFNTVTKKYLSFGYRNKATWNSPVWVEKAVFENIHESEYENIEIHIYPVSDAEKIPFKSFNSK